MQVFDNTLKLSSGHAIDAALRHFFVHMATNVVGDFIGRSQRQSVGKGSL